MAAALDREEDEGWGAVAWEEAEWGVEVWVEVEGAARGGSGMGGSTSRGTGSNSALKLDLDFYQIEEAAEKLTIEQNGASIDVKLELAS